MATKNINQPVTQKHFDKVVSRLNKSIKLQDKHLNQTIEQQNRHINKMFELQNKHNDNRFSDLTEQMNSLFRLQKTEFQQLSDKFDQHEQKQDQRYSEMMKHIDGIAGKYKKVDEEQIIASHQIKKHHDRIEILETAVFATA